MGIWNEAAIRISVTVNVSVNVTFGRVVKILVEIAICTKNDCFRQRERWKKVRPWSRLKLSLEKEFDKTKSISSYSSKTMEKIPPKITSLGSNSLGIMAFYSSYKD